jgi:streptomycin 6-kinase
VDVIAAAAGLEHKRRLKWVLAGAGLSASWHLEDGTKPDTAVAVAQMALAKL